MGYLKMSEGFFKQSLFALAFDLPGFCSHHFCAQQSGLPAEQRIRVAAYLLSLLGVYSGFAEIALRRIETDQSLTIEHSYRRIIHTRGDGEGARETLLSLLRVVLQEGDLAQQAIDALLRVTVVVVPVERQRLFPCLPCLL